MNRDHPWIAARIPHSGTMCLLDRVLEGDAARIVCATSSHGAPDHPLRAHGVLSAVHAIEYAAQAMALHRAFADGADTADADANVTADAGAGASHSAPPHGMLTSVRGVDCHVERLDDIAGELQIAVTRVSGDRDLVAYSFTVQSGTRVLVSGRITALLDVAALASVPAPESAPAPAPERVNP